MEQRKDIDEIKEMRMKTDALTRHLVEQEVEVLRMRNGLKRRRRELGVDRAGAKNLKQNKL